MTVCTVKGCFNSSEKQKKCDQITFHNFPADPVIADRWTRVIRSNRREYCWKPTKNTKICSKHFHKKDMYSTKKGIRRIRRGAVPAKRLFLSSSESESENMEQPEQSRDLRVETISTEKYPDSRPRLFLSSSESDSENMEHPEQPHDLRVETISTEISPDSRPCTSSGQQSEVTTVIKPDNVRIQSANVADENNAGVLTENTFHYKPEPEIHSSDLDSIVDTPRENRLRRKLRRKSALQFKHARLIKSLRQKVQRLEKQNASLKQTLLTLKKQRYIDNNVANILPKNSFAASLSKKISKNKKRSMPKNTPEVCVDGCSASSSNP